jgi:DNA-binding NarL/FixJ family response regulator
MPAFSTVIAEDNKGYCRFLRSIVEQKTHCRIVGEAFDGFEAVLKAEKLQPDIILLDIGLPTLNGLDAARQIRKLSPNSKILFVSQNTDYEVVQAALRLGGHGYLLKSDAAELPVAIETVFRGAQFVSSRLNIVSIFPCAG